MILSGEIPPFVPNSLDRTSVYTDAISSHFPPYNVGWGFIIHVGRVNIEDKLVYTAAGHIQANCVPEQRTILGHYQAIHEALVALTNANRMANPINVYCDSAIIVGSLDRSTSPPRPPELRKSWNECVKMAAPFSNLKFIWENKREIRGVHDLILSYLNSVAPVPTAK